jgi:putative SOS response-associated peptidase YedK
MAGWHGVADVHDRHHDASAMIAELHNKMPVTVILEPEDWSAWLEDVAGDLAVPLNRLLTMC